MDCRNVADILDARAESRLSSDERCAVDAHLSGCESCRRAWQAQNALLALPMPAAPADLLHRALAAVAQPATRRRRSGVFAGTMLLAGGAVLAAVVAVTVSRSTKSRSEGTAALAITTPTAPRAGAEIRPTDDNDASATPPSSEPARKASPADLPDTVYSPLVRTPPYYPKKALEQRLDGYVQVKFTITETGATEDITAVESSDPIFEPPAVLAVSQWKYLPTIVSGKRVPVRDIHTILRFQLAPPNDTKTKTAEAPLPEEAQRALVPPHGIDPRDFEDVLEQAWEHVAMRDLRGAELVLDDLRATYELNSSQVTRVWDFYAYIYTQYGDFGRAIAAYETAIAASESRSAAHWTGTNEYVELAHLYFARNQYDMALRTLLRDRKRMQGRRVDPAVTAFIDRLRQLGITEETL